jgi:ADP-dependent glucokinase
MAEYLATAGIGDTRRPHNVTLVAHTGPKLRSLLHPHIQVPAPCYKTDDELHLILEYQQHESFHGLTGGRANRFIFSHDDTNGRMLASDELQGYIAQSPAPDVLVLSGLNMLDGHNETVIVGKLNVRVGGAALCDCTCV